jgi:hypothetical protein
MNGKQGKSADMAAARNITRAVLVALVNSNRGGNRHHCGHCHPQASASWPLAAAFHNVRPKFAHIVPVQDPDISNRDGSRAGPHRARA